jgi:trehalose 6-phosphate phosphatase
VLIDEIDLRTCAVLLDVDGTILDIAPRPADVRVPERLKPALSQLSTKTGGALALVSGRLVEDLDYLFAPLKLASVGGHGAEIRVAGDELRARPKNWLDLGLKHRLAEIAASAEGIILEDKVYSLALHYRLAPEHGDEVRAAVQAACASYPSSAIEALAGKSVIEIKPPNFNKGTGIRELMTHSPFRGRRPVFIGDDVTDEAAFAVLPEFGGMGFSVGRSIPGLAGCFPQPRDVRQWLYRMTNGAGRP